MLCPDCRHDNIAGSDVCEKCGQPFSRLHAPPSELERSIVRHPVSVLSHKRPVTVDAAQTVRSAIELMVQQQIGCVAVLEAGRLAGLFTERDVLNRITVDHNTLSEPVQRHMTRCPTAIQTTDTLAYALHAMSVNGYRHLPVMDPDGALVSVISVRDILRLLAVRFADIRSV